MAALLLFRASAALPSEPSVALHLSLRRWFAGSRLPERAGNPSNLVQRLADVGCPGRHVRGRGYPQPEALHAVRLGLHRLRGPFIAFYFDFVQLHRTAIMVCSRPAMDTAELWPSPDWNQPGSICSC